MEEELSRIPAGGGPHIVAIGGGTGLSTMLRGLKYYTHNITAVVTMADDGGGSGVLRHDLGMPPPGDLRNCLEALADVEPIMEELLSYRFHDGSLAGQSFGNLFLAALDGISPSFETAVERMNQILAVKGKVLPVTADTVDIVAEFENGTSIRGESKISAFKRSQHCRIRRVRMEPKDPKPLKAALDAIARADVILLGPGSLYTSIIPNLLVPGIADAVAASPALRIYIANIMTQEGETEGYTLSEHLQALADHGRSGMIDLALGNSAIIPANIRERYQTENAFPLMIDGMAVRRMGVELICEPLSDISRHNHARHDPRKLKVHLLLQMHAALLAVVDGLLTGFEEDGEVAALHLHEPVPVKVLGGRAPAGAAHVGAAGAHDEAHFLHVLRDVDDHLGPVGAGVHGIAPAILALEPDPHVAGVDVDLVLGPVDIALAGIALQVHGVLQRSP